MGNHIKKIWETGDRIQAKDLNRIEQELQKIAPFDNHLIQIYDEDKLNTYKYGDYVIDPSNDKLYRATRDYPDAIILNNSWQQIENLGEAIGILDRNSKNAIESVATYVNDIQQIPALYYLNDNLQRQIETTRNNLNNQIDSVRNLFSNIKQHIPELYYLNDQLQRTIQSTHNQLQKQIQTINKNLSNNIKQVESHVPTLYYFTDKLCRDIEIINQNINNIDNQFDIINQKNNILINNITANIGNIASLYSTLDNFYREFTNTIEQIYKNYLTIDEYIANSSNVLGNIYIKVDAAQRQLQNKQDITPMIQYENLYLQLDQVERTAHQETMDVQVMSAAKSITELSMLKLDEIERGIATKINTQDFINRISTITGYLLTNIDQLDAYIVTNRTNINSNLSAINNLSLAINNRIPKPTTSSANGILGQVLSTNGDGTTQWIDAFTPADGQIEDAVATWLDNNPSATTTVANGSITLEKLSQEVVDAIHSSEDAQEALSTVQALISHYQAHIHDNIQQREFINMRSEYNSKLLTYAGHFNCGRYNNRHDYLDADGFGFLFFTDPHLIDGKSYGHPPEKLLKGLQIIRNLLDMTPAHYVICGGDWLNEGYRPNNSDETGANIKSQALAVLGSIPNLLRDRISTRVYNIAGNHEYIYGLHGSNELTEKHLAHLWYDKDINYYTVDTNTTKCYLFDSGTMAEEMTDYRWTQVQWFGNLLLNSTVPHHFGAIHIAYLNGDGENGIKSTPELLIDNLCKIANAFNNKTTITLNNITYNFSNTIGKFHFMLAGHLHGDFDFTINGIPVILSRAFLRGYAVDGVYANFSEAKLYLTRFGQGSNREFSIISNN